MIFHLYNDESIQPDIYDRTGLPLDLPLVATSLKQQVEMLPLVTLSLRARHLEFVTCNGDGWPEVLLDGFDLLTLLDVTRVTYESGPNPGDGVINLEIQLTEGDEATVE